jgi:hypothetical protein
MLVIRPRHADFVFHPYSSQTSTLAKTAFERQQIISAWVSYALPNNNRTHHVYQDQQPVRRWRHRYRERHERERHRPEHPQGFARRHHPVVLLPPAGRAGPALHDPPAQRRPVAYPKGWEDYNAMASYDRINWFRVPTSFDGQVLTIEHTPGMDSVYYAYFEPYSWERHLELLDRAQMSEHVRMLDLGSTVDGRDLNMLVIGEPAAGKKKVWVIARQHPGETMAEWFVEGMLDALLDPAHPFGRQLLKERCSTWCRT